MARGVLVIQTEVREGREEAFDQFYDEIHIPEILATHGFRRARRFKAVRSPSLPTRPDGEWHTNLAIYEVEADDLAAAYATLIERMQQGGLTSSDVFSDVRPYRAQLYEEVFALDAP